MKIKLNLSKLIFLLMIINVISMQNSYAESLKYHGIVGSYNGQKGLVSISGETYLLDREALIHRPVHSTKLSLDVSRGQRVEFSVDKNVGAYSRILELWVLSE